MANTKEYKEGYDAAIQSLKDMLNGKNNQNQQGNRQGIQGTDSQGNPAQSPELNPKDQKQADKNNQGSQGGQGEQSRGEGNTGKVSASDMTTDSNVNGTHKGDGGIAGGFCDKQEGDKLAEQEGYDKDSMSENSRADDWKETAMKESSKLSGSNAGHFKSVLDGLYKVSTDWKKTLKNIVGRSLNPAEFRQAFANKNVLVSQDRIARTDKDKYDNLDYICCFIDSSGSLSDNQLKMILSEVYSLALQKKPCRLIVVQCDTQIQEIKEYVNLKDLKKDAIKAGVKGRGGTYLKPCWDLLRDKKDKRFAGKRCELVMVFTDGYDGTQFKRDVKTMQNLVYCILDNTSFKLENKDASTKVLHFKTNDIK